MTAITADMVVYRVGESGDEEEVELVVAGTYTSATRAVLWGDNAHPGDPEDVDVGVVTHNGRHWRGELTPQERESARELLLDAARDAEEDYDDDDE
jgi:hypothetical protein